MAMPVISGEVTTLPCSAFERLAKRKICAGKEVVCVPRCIPDNTGGGNRMATFRSRSLTEWQFLEKEEEWCGDEFASEEIQTAMHAAP